MNFPSFTIAQPKLTVPTSIPSIVTIYDSAMNKNQSYYIEAWKKHVANQRLLNAIPDFELVFGKSNLLAHDYHKAIDYYKSNVLMLSSDLAGKETKNSYLTFLNKLLEEENQGFKMALLLYSIRRFIVSQDPQKLQDSILEFESLFHEDPTLIAIIPIEIILSIQTAKIKKQTLSNVIYITHRHTFSSCYKCAKIVQGNECSIVTCLCSTKIYHSQCATTAGKRCYICNSIHTSINSSKKNKLEHDKNNSSGTNKSIKTENYKSTRDSATSKYGTKKTTYGFSNDKSCFISNNATMWDDGIC